MPKIKTVSRKGTRAKRVTLNDVWAGFAELQKSHAETEAVIRETQEAQKKAHAETEAAIKETQAALKETQEAQKKAHAETEAVIKETQRMLGDLGNKFGDEAEHTLIPGLPGKFRDLGFVFGAMSRNRKIHDYEHDIHTEVDAFLENGVQEVAVEVKAKLQKADVDGHIKRMEKLRAYADLHGDRRDLFGALAATVVHDKEREYALENGFYVIEPSGEDVTVTSPGGSPRIWQASSG